VLRRDRIGDAHALEEALEFIISTLVTHSDVTLFPVARSNSGTSSRYAPLDAADSITLISACNIVIVL